ncbi:MAG: thymidylate synthase [Archaeoglobaceae archaeon]|nr:thymidylate synthase [Archaeoglobaceae archaeon]MDW7989117.1 thymidylate synthase [Archaeoglobaceae archaeon]
MIFEKDFENAKAKILGKIIRNGELCKSRFGNSLNATPTFLVIEKPEFSQIVPDLFIEKYCETLKKMLGIVVGKLRERPYTRRISIPLWTPKDHLSKNPVAITEISFLFDGKLHLTAYIRSLECLNYFDVNFHFLSNSLEEVSQKAELDTGSIALLVSIPHIYERDVSRAEIYSENCEEIYGYTDLGTHLVEDYISSAWHSAMELIYNYGKIKETEWEMFEGQKRSKFVHRLFIEVKNPEENKIHDKAPFTERYCIDYAHSYVIHHDLLNRTLKSILRDGEEYTYAERARYCEKDDIKVDQLYEVIEKLKIDKCRRDCYVGISRYWDLKSSDPPCLRGYQFVKKGKKLSGIFYMRSNDVYGAMHANMFAFALLTKYVAEIVGFKEYDYAHFVVDAHIYEGFIHAVKEILYPDMKRFQVK